MITFIGSSPRKPTSSRVIVSGIGENTNTTGARHDFLNTQTSFGSTPSPIPGGPGPGGSKSPVPPGGSSILLGGGAAGPVHGTITTIHRDGKKETLINDIGHSHQVSWEK